MADQPPEGMDEDQVVRQMQVDDRLTVPQVLREYREDGYEDEDLDTLMLMSPRDYALKRGMQPQQVYYYIKKGVIQSIDCICHRHVIDANQADRALAARKAEREQR